MLLLTHCISLDFSFDGNASLIFLQVVYINFMAAELFRVCLVGCCHYVYIVCRCVFEIDVLYKQLQNTVALCQILTNGLVQFVINISKSIDFIIFLCN